MAELWVIDDRVSPFKQIVKVTKQIKWINKQYQLMVAATRKKTRMYYL